MAGVRLSREKRNDLLYLVARAVWAGVPLVPRPVGLGLFGALGSLLFRAPTRDRRRTLTHLRLIYGGQWSEPQIASAAQAVYRELGRNLYDAVYLARLKSAALERHVRCDDLTPFRAAYDRGRGLIGVSAHTGCFEMILPYFARKGFRCVAVGKEVFDRRIDEMVSRARSGPNMIYLHRDEAGREVIRRLKEGMAFATLIDQDTDVEGVFARFLGRLAYTPSSPVKFAMKWDIPLFVATTARQPDDTHRIFVSAPVTMIRSDDPRRDLVLNVQKVNDLICETIRAYPTQWVWMHRRWQRKPTDPGMENVASIEQYE